MRAPPGSASKRCPRLLLVRVRFSSRLRRHRSTPPTWHSSTAITFRDLTRPPDRVSRGRARWLPPLAGPMGRYLNGRRVAFVASTKSGAWAEYVMVPQRLALPLGGQVSLQAGAMSVVNPMTALAFLEMTKSAGSRAVVNTAAAGALGRMIDRVLSSEGIEVINLVRRAEQVEVVGRRRSRHRSRHLVAGFRH